jgi:hypothetical protein
MARNLSRAENPSASKSMVADRETRDRTHLCVLSHEFGAERRGRAQVNVQAPLASPLACALVRARATAVRLGPRSDIQHGSTLGSTGVNLKVGTQEQGVHVCVRATCSPGPQLHLLSRPSYRDNRHRWQSMDRHHRSHGWAGTLAVPPLAGAEQLVRRTTKVMIQFLLRYCKKYGTIESFIKRL